MTRLSLLLLLLLSSTAFAQRQSGSTGVELEHFTPAIDTVRDPGRHFIMPTAQAIEGGFLGAWELAFLQGGVGLDNVVSIWAGITAMPTVAFRSQFAFVNLKLTVADEPMFAFALGGNFLRLTSQLPYFHLYAVGTYEHEDKTRITGNVFYKVSGEDYPVVDVVPYGAFAFAYGGSLGGGIGFDTPFLNISNMRLIGELWNHDIQAPSKLMGLIALRVESTRFSSDFGFAYFTMPLLAPVANFVWRF